jgi:hypothetical protein
MFHGSMRAQRAAEETPWVENKCTVKKAAALKSFKLIEVE